MKKFVWPVGAVILVILIMGGAYEYWHLRTKSTSTPTHQDTITGESYVYQCDTGVSFSITPSKDMLAMSISPINGGAFPPASVLKNKPATPAGERVFEGNGVRLTAKGIAVKITGNNVPPLNCSSVPKENQLPLIFSN